MTYVDAFHDRKNDRIYIAERINGHRNLRSLPANYVFYYDDPNGSYRSIFGHHCAKFITRQHRKFRDMLDCRRTEGRTIFESDINPVFRCLADNYMGADAPILNVGFFDIEANFHPVRGYAPTTDPFNEITAITLYRTGDQKLLTFVLCPPTVELAEAQRIASEFSDTVMFDDEKKMLEAFLTAIEDVDVLTGWNSCDYDIPYTVNRVGRLLSQNATRKFCLWKQKPSERKYVNKFGKPVITYDLVGRVHLDYMELYAKHNTQQRLSYALNAIGEIEVGEFKTPYSGTLDDLYKKDLKLFIEYNRQDVMLMVKIDQKNKFIDLANQIAHANCVLLKTTMGSVALVEQAIINEMHAMGRIVPDRPERDDPNRQHVDINIATLFDDEDEDEDEGDERTPVVGAYVASPKKGLHEHIGAVDINSLYPSAIRALNMSPETLVGQVRQDETMALIQERAAALPRAKRAEAWDGIFATLEVTHMHNRDDTVLTVDFFDYLNDTTRTETMTGAELYDFIYDDANHVCITANGTIFRTDVDGMIPRLLTTWYADRKVMQGKAKAYAAMAAGVVIDADLLEALQAA